MFRRLIFLVFAGLLFSDVQAALNLPEILYPLIEQKLDLAKLDLDNNILSSSDEVEGLKAQLDGIWADIKTKEFAETVGVDNDLRAAYVTMQGIIESAIIEGLEKREIKDVVIDVITPRMPTPLMLSSGRSLGEINLKEAQGFAQYRNPILIELLKAGVVINAYYSDDTKDALSEQTLGLGNYASYCKEYSNLIDQSVIPIDIEKFPAEMTGALYTIDGESITIESRQLTQIDNAKEQSWMIKFGKKAELRKGEVNKFLEKFF